MNFELPSVMFLNILYFQCCIVPKQITAFITKVSFILYIELKRSLMVHDIADVSYLEWSVDIGHNDHVVVPFVALVSLLAPQWRPHAAVVQDEANDQP